MVLVQIPAVGQPSRSQFIAIPGGMKNSVNSWRKQSDRTVATGKEALSVPWEQQHISEARLDLWSHTGVQGMRYSPVTTPTEMVVFGPSHATPKAGRIWFNRAQTLRERETNTTSV